MTSSYSVAEVQKSLPDLLGNLQNCSIAIRRRDETVAYILSRERMEAILETLDILSNPRAVKALRDHKSGKTKFSPLSALDRNKR